MPYNILSDINMNANDDSGVIAFADANGKTGSQKGRIILNWKDVTGTLDGTIEVFLYFPANDANSVNTNGISLGTVTVDSANGAYEFIITERIDKISIAYTKNNITGGTLQEILQLAI